MEEARQHLIFLRKREKRESGELEGREGLQGKGQPMDSRVARLLPTNPITMIHKAHQVKLSRSSGGEEHARVLLAVGSVPRYQSMCGTSAQWWIRSGRRNSTFLKTCALNAFSTNHLASVKSRKMVNATKRR